MNRLIGLKEFRNKVSEIAQRTGKGESFIVLSRSKPIFRVTPVSEDSEWEEVIDFTKIKRGGIKIQDLLSRL